MMTLKNLNIVGIMTGNSLDGADLVLTQFNPNGEQTDILAHSVNSPEELKNQLRWLRTVINDSGGDMEKVANEYSKANSIHTYNFEMVSDNYISFIADAVIQLEEKLKVTNADTKIDLIGFHGQTCAHFPPSIAKSKDPNLLYTVQIGDAQKLADLTSIPVAFDFRSDDLMNLGEAAPLAPVHHQHLAEQTRKKGQFPIAFCNAGNTGNITIISENKNSGELTVSGWDCGPFNNFPDKLMQSEKNETCDQNGDFGKKGQVNMELLALLFNQSVLTKDGENFLLKIPPRSSDPEWYVMLPELTDQAPVVGKKLSFEDRLRTAEYFSAYIYFHTLSFIPDNTCMPGHFAVCGGGWKNPISFEHFAGLVNGDFKNNPVLPEHKSLFKNIYQRILKDNNKPDFKPTCQPSEFYGFDGTAMEARIFADAAFCRLTGQAFSLPSTTGVNQPTVAGIIRYPNNIEPKDSDIYTYLDHYNSHNLTVDKPQVFDGRWSRASKGWNQKL